MIRIDDPWKQLRSECFGNVEPEVVLEAVTVPLDNLNKPSDSRDFWDPIETMPAWSAAISYGSREKMAHDLERRKSLNRKLIDLGHLTPIESLQFNFRVSGISKACGAQISRQEKFNSTVPYRYCFRSYRIGNYVRPLGFGAGGCV